MIILLLLIIFADKKTLPAFLPAFKLCISAVLVGATFKILHWPYADLILMFSIAFIAVLYVTQLVLRPDKSLEEYVKTIFVSAFTLGTLYDLMHWKGALYFDIVAIICGVTFLILQLLKYIQKRKTKAISPPDNENNL